jgi:hypothetical protein
VVWRSQQLQAAAKASSFILPVFGEPDRMKLRALSFAEEARASG